VVACNTVSSVSLDAIKSRVDVPVIGVIEPGARAALSSTRNGRIGIIGTEATIASGAYAKAIRDLDASVEVLGLPCPLFVPLVEEGWTEGVIVELIAERYLAGVKDRGIDTLVLGCTHYPLLKSVLAKIMGKQVMLIDSAVETSREIRRVLTAESLLRPEGSAVSREYYVTDSPAKFVKVGERFLAGKIDYIKKIELGSEV
jgi:glutamate racemase